MAIEKQWNGDLNMRKKKLENKEWHSRLKGMEIGKQVDGVQGSKGPGDYEIRWGTKGKP